MKKKVPLKKKSTVNASGNYTKPSLRASLFFMSLSSINFPRRLLTGPISAVNIINAPSDSVYLQVQSMQFLQHPCHMNLATLQIYLITLNCNNFSLNISYSYIYPLF